MKDLTLFQHSSIDGVEGLLFDYAGVYANLVKFLKFVGQFISLEQRNVACTVYVCELKIAYCRDQAVNWEFRHAELFVEYFE